MKITGSAPKIAIPTFLYMLIAIAADYLTNPIFKITADNFMILLFAGIIMILTGTILVITTGRKLLRSFNKGKLMSDGLYRVFRNPMYAAYFILIIPGICLLFNSWFVLTTVLVNYVLLQIFIKGEYRYLEEKFGDEYQAYLKKVWFKFL